MIALFYLAATAGRRVLVAIGFAVVVLAIPSAGAHNAVPILYRVSIAPARPAPIVKIELRFRGDADGETDLDLPNRWAGVDRLWANTMEWRVRGGRFVAGDGPQTRRIRHRPNARLTVSYRLRDPDPALPGPSYEKAIPAIEPDWFYIHGEGAFAIPSGREDASARFVWGRVPTGWTVASDLDRPPASLSANQVAGSILIGGTALRLANRDVGGGTLRIATLGRWSFGDAAFADRLAGVIASENRTLGDTSIPFFVPLVPLTNPKGDRISYGGTGRTGGFALSSTDNVTLAQFTRLIAHEYGHRWFGGSFGPFKDGAADYWFTEGVNDWFAARTMIATGYWDEMAWIANLNAVLKRHATSPALKLSEQQIDAAFWRDDDAMQFSYDRGFLIGVILDAGLRRDGKPSLTAILAELARSPSKGASETDRFAAALDRVAPGALAKAIAMLPTGDAPRLAPDLLSPCGRIVTTDNAPHLVAQVSVSCRASLAGEGAAP